jgi:hypothetical protein
MLHKEFWGLLFLAFVVWIFMPGTPDKRIENACRPVGWAGNVVTSLSALVIPTQQQTTQGWFNKIEYGCKYLTWRLFYQDAYNAWVKEQAQPVDPASASKRTTAPLPDTDQRPVAPSKVP